MCDFFRRLSILVVFLLGGQALASTYEQSSPVPQGSVPFNLYAGYLILVQASVGPLKGLNVLVDTGASPAILDTRIAKKLHLEETPATLRVVGGTVQAASSVVASVTVGPVEQENVPVFIEDLSSMQRTISVQLDGIVGLDVLGKEGFVIDYSARRIHFGPMPALANSIPLRIRNGLAIVEADVNGMPAGLLIDTAAPSLFLFPRGGREQPAHVSKAELAAGNIGQFARKPFRLRSLTLGDVEFGEQMVSMAPDSGGVQKDFDGLLSPVALGVNRIAVDLRRGEIAFIR